MKRSFPSLLIYLGYVVLCLAWMLAARLVWEQTVWSWASGPQNVGFSLVHSGLGMLLLLAVIASLAWVLAVIIAAAITRNIGGRIIILQLVAYALAWGVITTPYGFWQRLFISKFTPSQATEFFTYAAASGDLRTVEAFLAHGVPVNGQTREGGALHGAAVEGEIEVMKFLLDHGADVNAVNAFGDSPLVSAKDAQKNATEAQELIIKHGGKLIRGSDKQRDQVIEEQVRHDIEQMNLDMPK